MINAKHILGLLTATTMLISCNQTAEQSGDTADNGKLAIAETSEAKSAEAPADNPRLAADLAEIDKSCRKMGNASDKLCACVVEEARKLTADELALTVAQLTGDAARADAVRPKLDIMGLSRGGGFMTQAPYACEG